MAVRKRDVNEIASIVSTREPRLDDSIGLWLDGILRNDVLMLLVLLFHKTMEPPFEGFHLAITSSFSHPSSMRIKGIARKS